MRLLVVILVGVLSSVAVVAPAHGQRRPTDELSRARVLDREGAKAYTEGRYNDAIRYFEEAYRLGGPPFELWNIAKCHLRLDQPEQAAEMLERYLETPQLPPEDREEATQQLEELKKRPSTLTVSSSPPGAAVVVDGKPIEGRTPVSVTLAPGVHDVAVKLDKHVPYTKQVEASFGRAVIVDAPLSKTERRPPPENPYGDVDEDRLLALRGYLGVVLPRHGEIGGSSSVGVTLSGTYRITPKGARPELAVGGLFAVNGDSWTNTVNAPVDVAGCSATLPGSFGATSLSLFGIGTAGVELVPRLRANAIGGLGVTGYAIGDQVGGDLFLASCTTSPGLRPALLLGGQLDYAITPMLHVSAIPIMAQIHPAFAGVRTAPVDASGIWARFGIAIGLGVDL